MMVIILIMVMWIT